ncbi:MAG: hypothetical protein ABSG25_07120 [Bryobacteraceae bacterium]
MKAKYKLLTKKSYNLVYKNTQSYINYNTYLLEYKKIDSVIFDVKYEEILERYYVNDNKQIVEYGLIFFFKEELILEHQIKLRLLNEA